MILRNVILSLARGFALCLSSVVIVPSVSSACQLEIDNTSLRTLQGGRYEALDSGGIVKLDFAIRRVDRVVAKVTASGKEVEDDVLSAGPCFGAVHLLISSDLEFRFENGGLSGGRQTQMIELGSFLPGIRKTRSLEFRLNEGQFFRPGQRDFEVEFLLSSSSNSGTASSAARTGLSSERRVLRDTVSIEPVYRLSIIGEVSPSRRVNLGDILDRGANTRPLSLHIVANDDYVLRFESQNDGQLVNKQSISGGINYRLVAGDEAISLRRSTPSTGLSGSATRAAGTTLPLRFESDSGYRKRAGVYRDTLFIELTPLLSRRN